MVHCECVRHTSCFRRGCLHAYDRSRANDEWETRMGRLQGKVAIVTGAGGGIGAAISRQFASEGAAVVGVDVDAGALDQMA